MLNVIIVIIRKCRKSVNGLIEIKNKSHQKLALLLL